MRAALFAMLIATPIAAAPCGGDFAGFLQAMEAEAVASGVPADKAAEFFANARQDPKVLKADRSQGVFRKTFLDFSQSLISKGRLSTARAKSESLDDIFTRAETEYGVSRGILLAFWAFETDFGQVQGDFNTRNALLTLAHDCRRPELFQPQVLAAAQLHALDEFDLDT
ncbi:MAG: lytic murein transglycosylase, partial [Pseudomonadota bacterium]